MYKLVTLVCGHNNEYFDVLVYVKLYNDYFSK